MLFYFRKEIFWFEISFKENKFLTDESKLCLLKDYPVNDLVLFLFNIRERRRDDSVDLSFTVDLPCSCPIYWLYAGYENYKPLLKNASNPITDSQRTIPYHCLDINSVLLSEQQEYCQNEANINACKGVIATTGTTEIAEQTPLATTTTKTYPICLPTSDPYSVYCNCSFDIDSLNVLECTNPLLNRTLADFSTDFKFNYVSFVGSAITRLPTNSFPNLNLAENATLVVSRISGEIADDILNGTIYTNQFRFVIRESSLDWLVLKAPFRNTNFSSLEFVDCSYFLFSINYL